MAATVVAMSSTKGSGPPLGAPMAIGLVPSSRSVPPKGATWLALPTAAQIPTMPWAACGRTYSAAGPAWLPPRTPTHPIPTARAFSIAMSQARFIVRWPSPLSPSSTAMAGVSFATLGCGTGLKPPSRNRARYCRRRNTPWVS